MTRFPDSDSAVPEILSQQHSGFPRRRLLQTLALSALGLFIGHSLAGAQASEAPAPLNPPKTLRIGIMSGEDEDIWAVVAKNAAREGLRLKIVPFSDYTAPNQALDEHDIDANAFQHLPYLQAQNKAHNYHFVPVGNTFFQPIGLYSHHYHAPADLPHGARIGLPNDPSNEGRALRMLQAMGLISVAPEAGLFPTALDVSTNPHDLQFQELDAGVIGRSLPDLDAAVVNTDWAYKAGIDVRKDRIGTETMKDNPYVNFIAVNASDAKAPWVPLLVRAFQQPDVRAEIEKVYHGTTVPGWTEAGQEAATTAEGPGSDGKTPS
ncbi:MetQ/NlpA family ABC transporter substrate-binding protein [Oecophyllibacter saccharovorans]|uniref:MetQ/NlpA family ABC transporter substrate-binding protein n=1 Tax=Oecophyllibacter saccharovorans TaxID=2558360 RepID=UPI0011442431|nr:MetQ/NlpA family ABC transporter substrate-binding protein [Oecophyllibacter saccharovorans]QDH14973.1 MetQ/NlpA family ABC transporter substrate-binding protein [Oecophyllibacter saccharovorans]